jgi:hypothetical protein
LDRLGIFKLVNVAIVIAAVIAGVAVSSEAEKYIGKDVFYIAPAINDSKHYFSGGEVEELQSVCPPQRLAVISLDSAMISYGDFSVNAKTIFTSSDCFALNNIQFSDGGAWGVGGEKENSIIINESLAWQLFGSLNAADQAVTAGNELYTVAGVARQGRIARDNCFAYLPAASQPGGQGIGSVFLQVSVYDKLSPQLQISAWLEAIFKNPGDYYITDLNRYLENIALKYKLLLMLIALYVAAVIAINSYRLVKYHYSPDKNLAKPAIMLSIILVLDVTLIVVLLNAVSVDIWLPHSAGSRLGELLRAITNSGYLPPTEYLLPNLAEISKLNAYANVMLVMGVVGLANFIFVHKG